MLTTQTELEPGTFNGRCDTCAHKPAFCFAEYGCGAKLWSHPPSRYYGSRDRQVYYAYDDCTYCNGKGQRWNYGFDTHVEQCPMCRKRAYAPRDAYEQEYDELITRAKKISIQSKKLNISWTDCEAWRTHPLAIEYRAILKHMWERPYVPETDFTIVKHFIVDK